MGAIVFAGLASSVIASSATANPVVLDFEGLGVLQDSSAVGVPGLGTAVIERVGNFYNGGLGGSGSGPGTDLGIGFSDNALALVDPDSVGLPQASGNFGGEPTPDTVLFFLTGSAATVNVAAGFDTGFSFFYSSFNFEGSIDVYSGLDATGDVLASLTLPTTPFNGAPDPTGQFSPFVPIGVSFDGIARSIDFGGTINQIGFDNITFGSDTPLDSNTTDPTVDPDPVPVPAPASLPLFASGLALLGFMNIRRRRSK